MDNYSTASSSAVNTVSTYTINSRTGDLSPTTLATVATGANCFGAEGLAVDPSGRFAFVANLMSNATDLATISMYTINSSTGVLTPTAPPTVATGLSPIAVTVDPSGRFAYVSNQDDGTISMYTINTSTGVLTPTTPATVSGGGGPFAVTVGPYGKFAYAPVPYGNFVLQFTIDSVTGVLLPNTPSEVPAGNNPAWVAVDPCSFT